MTDLKSRKEAARDFLRLASSGSVQQAYDLYIATHFKHHNAHFKGDRQSLLDAMAESARTQPNKLFEIQHALEDGNLVSTHSHVKIADGTEYAITHIFRFDGDKVVELWDFGQEVPADMPNENGMF